MTEDRSDPAREGIHGQTVLVTGGAGFIGGHLVASLAADNDVRVLDDLSAGSADRVSAGATLIRGDVRDGAAVEEAMEGVDVAYHLAAVVDVARSVEDPVGSHSVNVDGTLTVLEAARRTSTRVVLASSAAIYGAPESIPVHEDARTEPVSPYGLDKLAVDRYGALYHDLYGLPTVRLRPFNVYGPGQHSGAYSGVIGVFLDQGLAGEPITVHGDGTQTRDFVHVSDVVRAFEAAGATDHVGDAFNVGTGESVSIREVAETVRRVTGGRSEIRHTDPREGDVDHSRADVSRAEALLGYEPRVGLDEGLRTVVEGMDAATQSG